MYLLLGDPQDAFCTGVLQMLEAGGHDACMISNPLAQPFRFTWRLNTFSSASQLIWADGTRRLDADLAGVLVRSPGWIGCDDGNSADSAYLQAEMHAALLGWMWSLDCPVVNRYPAALWYHPQTPLPRWQPLLRQSGLQALDSLISNVEPEIRAFGANRGGALFAPFTAEARYRLDCDERWDQLAAMPRLGPIHLTRAPAAWHSACVVGSRVVWEGTRPAGADGMEPALTRFSAMAGLSFIEATVSLTGDGLRIAALYPYPRVAHFGQLARSEIVAGLVEQLNAGSALHKKGPVAEPKRRGVSSSNGP